MPSGTAVRGTGTGVRDTGTGELELIAHLLDILDDRLDGVLSAWRPCGTAGRRAARSTAAISSSTTRRRASADSQAGHHDDSPMIDEAPSSGADRPEQEEQRDRRSSRRRYPASFEVRRTQALPASISAMTRLRISSGISPISVSRLSSFRSRKPRGVVTVRLRCGARRRLSRCRRTRRPRHPSPRRPSVSAAALTSSAWLLAGLDRGVELLAGRVPSRSRPS